MTTRSQGIRRKRNSDHGSLLLIPPSIIILHPKPNTVGPQSGLSKAAHSRIGRRTAPYYGSVEIVCILRPSYLPIYYLILRFRSRRRKEHPVVRAFSPASDRIFIFLISSAIIEDVKNMREDKSALIAFYYLDYKDASKRGLRGLLTSLLSQLGEHSDCSQDVLYDLYTSCSHGCEQPSDAALANCLKAVLELPGQLPTFLIVDALDECPNTTGTPSAREEVLEFLDDLIGSSHPNLFICVTSRPEQDIQTALNPLTSASRLVSLHEEGGQKEYIPSVDRSFGHHDRTTQRWRAAERELVITTLSERSGGM